jgi:hypothetical protein
VIGIFDVLIACVAAWVLCDQFLTSVNYDSVGLDTQFQQGSGVFERYSVVVGFEGDPAAVGGGHATAAADIITGEWKGLEGWFSCLKRSQGRLPISRWRRMLATCSIQRRAWALSASSGGGEAPSLIVPELGLDFFGGEPLPPSKSYGGQLQPNESRATPFGTSLYLVWLAPDLHRTTAASSARVPSTA